MFKIREFLDRFLLSDHEWKKKYCPDLYHWIFEMSDEEKKKTYENFKGHLKETGYN